jgi:hypothetical protein
MTRPLLLLALAALPCAASGAAPLLPDGKEAVQTRQLLQAYGRYISGQTQHGWQGLSGLILPSFDVQTRYHGPHWRGQSGLRALDREAGFKPRPGATVTLKWLRFHGNTATVDVREPMAFPLTAEMKAKGVQGVTVPLDWEQTWRRTPEGWRLARFRFVPDRRLHKASPLTYTITVPGPA